MNGDYTSIVIYSLEKGPVARWWWSISQLLHTMSELIPLGYGCVFMLCCCCCCWCSWADPRGAAVRGQPMERSLQAPCISLHFKTQSNIMWLRSFTLSITSQSTKHRWLKGNNSVILSIISCKMMMMMTLVKSTLPWEIPGHHRGHQEYFVVGLGGAFLNWSELCGAFILLRWH